MTDDEEVSILELLKCRDPKCPDCTRVCLDCGVDIDKEHAKSEHPGTCCECFNETCGKPAELRRTPRPYTSARQFSGAIEGRARPEPWEEE